MEGTAALPIRASIIDGKAAFSNGIGGVNGFFAWLESLLPEALPRRYDLWEPRSTRTTKQAVLTSRNSCAIIYTRKSVIPRGRDPRKRIRP